MKTTLGVMTLGMLVWLAWHPVKQLPHKQTRLERQRAVEELYERCRPDFTLKQVEELPMPLYGDITGEDDQ